MISNKIIIKLLLIGSILVSLGVINFMLKPDTDTFQLSQKEIQPLQNDSLDITTSSTNQIKQNTPSVKETQEKIATTSTIIKTEIQATTSLKAKDVLPTQSTQPTVPLVNASPLLEGKWLWQYSTDASKKVIASVKTLDFSQLNKPSIENKYEAPNFKIEATTTLPFTYSAKFLYNLDECSGGPIYHHFIISEDLLIPTGKVLPYAGEGCRPTASNKEIYDHLAPFFKHETKTMQIISVSVTELTLSYPDPKTYFYFTKAQ